MGYYIFATLMYLGLAGAIICLTLGVAWIALWLLQLVAL